MLQTASPIVVTLVLVLENWTGIEGEAGLEKQSVNLALDLFAIE